jgi:hypothetical protein
MFILKNKSIPVLNRDGIPFTYTTRELAEMGRKALTGRQPIYLTVHAVGGGK